jgi:outer membrane protein TolC
MRANSYKNKSKPFSIIVILALVCVVLPINIKAQDSLSHYLIRSAQNNPALKASYNQYLSSLEMIPQVGSLPDPDVTFDIFIKAKEEVMGNQNLDVRLMQMFPWFGTLTTAKQEAALMAKARFQEFSEARNRLFFDMTSIYYQLYRLEKEKTLAEKNLKYLKTYEQLSLIRFKTSGNSASGTSNPPTIPAPTDAGNNAKQGGMNAQPQTGMSGQSPTSGGGMPQESAPMSKGKGIVDVLRVQMDINDLVSSIGFLEDQKTPLVASFNAYLNRPVNSPVFIPDTLMALKIDTTLKVLTDSVISNNPMLKMYAAEQESYKTKMEKSRLMGLPMFGLGIDYALMSTRADVMGPGNGADMIMPMVNIKLPIYRKKYTAMRKEAEYLMNASKNKQTSALNNLQVELSNALLNLKNAERKIELYNRQTNLADQSLKVLNTTYSTAGIDLEEVLRMQQKLLDYRYKLVEAVVDQNTGVANIGYLVAKQIVTDEYLKSNN